MKKVFCILVLGLLVAQICAGTGDKDKPEDTGTGAVKDAEAKVIAKGDVDNAKKPIKDAANVAQDEMPEKKEKKRKPVEDDDNEDCDPPKPHPKKQHKHFFDYPIDFAGSLISGGLGIVRGFADALSF